MYSTKSDHSHGIIAYNSRNIGDEIQSIAAMRFLPSVDEYVWRERINTFEPRSGKKTKCILNAWWMQDHSAFPPSDAVDPLLISMHFRPEIQGHILTEKTRRYFMEHGPVGCRDMQSMEWLQSEGIPAYFSGCLTLSLTRDHSIPRGDYILCVDVPEKIVEKIKSLTSRPVYSISRILFPFAAPERMEMARCVLSLYHNAHCCVSPRLHVILPCLAMETPVLRMIDDVNGDPAKDTRYRGVESFFHSVTVSEFMKNGTSYDFDTPPANPSAHLAMREELIERCRSFTGYDSGKTPVSSNDHCLASFIKIVEYREEDIYRSLFFAHQDDMDNISMVKKSRKVTHNAFTLGNVIDFRAEDMPLVYRLKAGAKRYLYRLILALHPSSRFYRDKLARLDRLFLTAKEDRR